MLGNNTEYRFPVQPKMQEIRKLLCPRVYDMTMQQKRREKGRADEAKVYGGNQSYGPQKSVATRMVLLEEEEGVQKRWHMLIPPIEQG
mmetsp:Transcript_35363/g.72372  ORF Transcript_35363/g.72372 Transcript_35363/m.72372 type:complete len:88 (-) Transcript_35363:395-658(-)